MVMLRGKRVEEEQTLLNNQRNCRSLPPRDAQCD